MTMLRQNKNFCGEINDADRSHLPALGEEAADIPDRGPDFSFLTIICCYVAAKTVHADNGWCSHTGMSFHIHSLPISFCQQLNANSFSCDVSLIVEIQAENNDGGQMQLESWTN